MATLDLDQFHRNAIPMSIRYFSYQQADSAQVCYVAGIVGESSAEAERGLMYSHEHDGCILRCYIPGNRAGSARGHPVREGSHGRYPRVSRAAVESCANTRPAVHDEFLSYQRAKVSRTFMISADL
jgi:hypothetical protein